MNEQDLLRKRKHAIDKGHTEQLVSVCQQLGQLYDKEERFNDALLEYKVEKKNWELLNKPINVAVANRSIGEIYTKLGEYEKALKYQKKHLEIAKHENDLIEQQRALVTIGLTYLSLGESVENNDESADLFNQATLAYKESFDVCDRLTGISKKEKMEMKARLFLNYGIVLQCQKAFSKSISSIEKAVEICKEFDLFMDLYRCYSALGMIHFQQNHNGKALDTLNLALAVASRLDDKINLTCEVLLEKGKVFFTLPDFQGAKQVLHKAYRMHCPATVRKSVEKNLKIAVSLCRAEEKLLTVCDSDFLTMKMLYEQMGDGASAVKNFTKAIYYYQKMLECAEAGGESGHALVPVYVSLAQTYRDNKQYDLALEFYQKELDLLENNPQEACETTLNIADVLELQASNYTVLEEMYSKARSLAVEARDNKLERSVLSALLITQKSCGLDELAHETEKELQLMVMDVGGDFEESSEEKDILPNVFDSVCLETLTDESDGDNEEYDWSSRPTRTCLRGLKVRKNEKGETQLHTACLSGNIALAKRLIEQHHPVNVQDHCGWSPLHEACNHGYRDIVELLLKNGASINDRGGTGCGGITPLHDAASCGHIEVMELLLERGASVVVRTNEGDTPLDCLLKFHHRQAEELDVNEESKYHTMEMRLRIALEKAGHQVSSNPTGILNENTRQLPLFNQMLAQPSDTQPMSTSNRGRADGNFSGRKNTNRRKKIGNLRRAYNAGSEESVSSVDCNNSSDSENEETFLNKPTKCSLSLGSPRNQCVEDEEKVVEMNDFLISSEEKINMFRNSSLLYENDFCRVLQDESFHTKENNTITLAVDPAMATKHEYMRVMTNLRTRQIHDLPNKTPEPLEELNEPKGFLSKDDVGEDWLENDLGTALRPNKRRKVQLTFENCRPTFPEISESSNSHCTSHKDSANFLKSNGFTEKINDLRIPKVLSTFESSEYMDSYLSNSSPQDTVPLSDTQQIPQCDTGFGRKRSHCNLTSNQLPRQFGQENESSHTVKVRVEDSLLLIPITTPNQLMTVGWLAKEAACRYFKIKGLKPSLNLLTKDGALLSDEDPISLVIGMEEVLSAVTSWNIASLAERYIETSKAINSELDSHIYNCLETCQATQSLRLMHLCLSSSQLTPVLQAINHCKLQELLLAGNVIGDEGVKLLPDCLDTIPNLKVLNLSCNNITIEGLRYLSTHYVHPASIQLKELVILDISHNPLGGESMKHITVLLNTLSNLKTLNLQACDLNLIGYKELFSGEQMLCIDSLESLDISYNPLGREGVSYFLGRLVSGQIITLNVACTNGEEAEGSIAGEVGMFLGRDDPENLESLDLSSCAMKDSDVWQLLRCLCKAHKLKSLSLRNNPELTCISLRRLIQHEPSATALDLYGCLSITSFLEDSIPCNWVKRPVSSSSNQPYRKLEFLTISFDMKKYLSENVEILLQEMWSRAFGLQVVVRKIISGGLQLTIIES